MVITLDLETSSLSWQTGGIYLCGYTVDGSSEVTYVDPNDSEQTLRSLLADPANTLCGHNIRFDALFLSNAGYDIRCKLEDTKVLAYLTWPNATSHSLKDLVRERLFRSPTKLQDILFKPLKKELDHLESYKDLYYVIDGKWVRKDLLKEYHREDVLNVDRLRSVMVPTDWFLDVEMPLTRILFEMELYGCPIDKRYLNVLQYELDTRTRNLLEKLQSGDAGFNPGSSKQVADKLLCSEIDLDEECEKTETGQYQIDKSFLKRLAWKGNTFAKDLLEYRRLSKILSTYVSPFISGAEGDGRLHGSINQAGSENIYGDGARGTNTGRLSSSNPNLQNIPARTEEGKKVRKAFIASEGKFMFDSDLKQIEPRLIGHYSQSPKLIKAYREGLDTHGLFAHDIFGSDTSGPVVEGPNRSITATERFIGKTSWLATVYGCSYRKLLFICEQFSDSPLELDVTKYYVQYDRLPESCKGVCFYGCKKHLQAQVGRESREIYARWMFFKRVQDRFKAANPEIMGWRDAHINRTRRLGYVVTIGGRRIDIPDLDSRNMRLRMDAERKAVNYLIQGSAADAMKMILVEMDKKLVKPGRGRVFATIHDEVLGELNSPDDLQIVRDVMEKTVTLRNVPIESDTKLVANWGDK